MVLLIPQVGSWNSNANTPLDLRVTDLKFYDSNGAKDAVFSECTGRCPECNPPTNPDNYLYLDGQLQLPGLFALHDAGSHIVECGDELRYSGLLNLEGFLYAIDMINNDPDILPGVTLGTTVFDTCMSSSRTVRDLSSLFSGSHVSLTTNQLWSSIIGVVGSESEEVTLSTAKLTDQYKYTQVRRCLDSLHFLPLHNKVKDCEHFMSYDTILQYTIISHSDIV